MERRGASINRKGRRMEGGNGLGAKEGVSRFKGRHCSGRIRAVITAMIFVGISVGLDDARGQSLLNVDFGVGRSSGKRGFAATGQATNDVWNLYTHYESGYRPGMSLVTNGVMHSLKFADGNSSYVSLSVTNAPGVWGNVTRDPMMGSYIFAHNEEDILVSLTNLSAGYYHFYLYGYAQEDVMEAQRSVFMLSNGREEWGPRKATPHEEVTDTGSPYNYAVFRNVEVFSRSPVTVRVSGGPEGVAVLNGMQIHSRGTRPPQRLKAETPKPSSVSTNLVIHRAAYEGSLGRESARLDVTMQVESFTTNRVSASLFSGNVAVLGQDLPESVWVNRREGVYRLFKEGVGRDEVTLEVYPKVEKDDEMRRVDFRGPPAAISSIALQADETDFEVDFLSGVPGAARGTGEAGEDDSMRRAYLMGGRRVAFQWQPEALEIRRDPFVAVETEVSTQVTRNGIQYVTALGYEVLQAPIARFEIEVGPQHTVTDVVGSQIRTWKVAERDGQQILTVDLSQPGTGSYDLKIVSDQTLESGKSVPLTLPFPRDAQRETGRLGIRSEAMQVDIASAEGLRRVGAEEGASLAYRFYERPAGAELNITPRESEVLVEDAIEAGVEDGEWGVTHAMAVTVDGPGIYELAFELPEDPGTMEVSGSNVADWRIGEGRLIVSFAERVIGETTLEVRRTSPLGELPATLRVEPLRGIGVKRERVRAQVRGSRGIRLQTSASKGLRELPTGSVEGETAQFAFAAVGTQWRLEMRAMRLEPRLFAEVFHLITVGDVVVGGSSVVRYSVQEQGVKELQLKLPGHWENIEFTGQGIRRRERDGGSWTVVLEEPVWDAYTLVVTYTASFDPSGASLDLSGPEVVDTERQSGHTAVTVASGLDFTVTGTQGGIRRIDPMEIPAGDRALAQRPILWAYRYREAGYELTAQVQRRDQVGLVESVAEWDKLTTVITESGQAVTQASLAIKKRSGLYQRFRLPDGAELWGCYVDGEPVKVEREDDWYAVSGDAASAGGRPSIVSVKYAHPLTLSSNLRPQTVTLKGPETAIPATYSQWEFHLPEEQHLLGVGGEMHAERSVDYSFGMAVRESVEILGGMVDKVGRDWLIAGGIGLFLVCFVAGGGLSRWLKGTNWRAWLVFGGVALIALLVIISSLLPSLSTPKKKAQHIKHTSNLKQIGTAAKTFALNHGRYPTRLSEMMNELGNTEQVLIDPKTGRRVVYLGADSYPPDPDRIIAYFEREEERVPVLFGDGDVTHLTQAEFRRALADERQRASGQAVANAALAAEAEASIREEDAAADQPPGSEGPVATGIRSIRIDLPERGRSYSVKKLLHLGGEPLGVELRLVNAHVWRAGQGGLQAVAALAGALLLLREWRRARRRSFWLALGTAFLGGALVNLLMAAHALHWAVVGVVAGGGVVLIACVAWGVGSRLGRTAARSAGLGMQGLWLSGLFMLFPFHESAANGASEGNRSSGKEARSYAASILSADFSGSVEGDRAHFTARISMASMAAGQAVDLVGEGAALERYSTDAENLVLMREEEVLRARMEQPGRFELTLELWTRVKEEGGRQFIAFELPKALANKITVKIPETQLDVRVPGAVSVRTTSQAGATEVRAVLGPTTRFEMSWGPAGKAVAGAEPVVFSEKYGHVTIGNGLLGTETAFDYTIAQGALSRLTVALPPEQRLVKVEGPRVQGWEVRTGSQEGGAKEGAGKELIVRFSEPITGEYRLSVSTERALPALPTEVAAELPRTRVVKRETGMVAIEGDSTVDVTLDVPADLRRVDPDDWRESMEANLSESALVYHFDRPFAAIQARLAEIKPQIEADIYNHVWIEKDQVALAADITYHVKKAGIFSVKLAIPDGFAVESVESDRVSQWHVSGAGSQRILEVDLASKIEGGYPLKVFLTCYETSFPGAIELPAIFAPDAGSISGYMAVGAAQGIDLTTSEMKGLTEIPSGHLQSRHEQMVRRLDGGEDADSKRMLAYQFSSRRPESAPMATLDVTMRDPWAQAESFHLFRIDDNRLDARAWMRYQIENAPLSVIELELPKASQYVNVSGLPIRERHEDGNRLRLKLQRPVYDTVPFQIEWERDLSNSTNRILLHGVRSVGVQRESARIGIAAVSPMRVTPMMETESLRRIGHDEIPGWVAKSSKEVLGKATWVRGYELPAPDHGVPIEVGRMKQAAVLQAIVDRLELTTVVAEAGETMTRMRLDVENNGRQFVSMGMTNRARIWTASCNGQPVRPTRREEEVLLPLTGQGEGASVQVEVVMVSTNEFPRYRGQVRLESPRFDVPVKEAGWQIYLPERYRYRGFDGTMERVEGGSGRREYDLVEYQQQATSDVEARRQRARDALSKVRRSLKEGDAKGAQDALTRARQTGPSETGLQNEIAELSERTSRLQSSNLIRSQQRFAQQSRAQSGSGDAEAAYNGTAATKQWERLSQAQQVAGSDDDRLEVNLPAEGKWYRFEQLLQVESDRAFQVRFHAVADRATGWKVKLALGVAGFLLLWGAIAMVCSRRSREHHGEEF